MDKSSKGITHHGAAITVLLLLAIFFSTFFLHKHNRINFDFGQQVISGQFIIQHKQVINSNNFSYADTDLKNINNQWGSSVIFYYVHKLWGLSGLTVLALLLNLLSFFLILRLAVTQNNYWLIIFISLLVLPLLTISTSPNPEMFSLLFFTISIFLILNYAYSNSKHKYLWFLPIVQLFWVNFDGLFFIGLFLQFLLLLHLIINRRSRKDILTFTFIFVLSITACFINPYGIDGVLLTLKSLTEANYQIGNASFPYLHARLGDSLYFFYFEWMFFLAVILLYYWVKNFNLVKQNIFIIALFSITLLLVFWRISTVIYFGYVFIIMAAHIVKQFNSKVVKRTSIVLTAILLFSIVVFKIHFYLPYETVKPGTGIEKSLVGGASYFIKHKLQGPIFNTPEMGAYLTYYLYHNEQVFVNKNAYADEFADSVVIPVFENQKKWLDLDNKYNFNIVYLNYDRKVKKFTHRLLMDSRWFLAYHDDYCVIFLKRNKENDPLVRKELLDKLSLAKMMNRFNSKEFVFPIRDLP